MYGTACHLCINEKSQNDLKESSMQATSDSSSLHWEHCLESEGKVGQPKGSSGFTAIASS